MSDMQIGAGMLSNAITIKPQQGRASWSTGTDAASPVPDEIPAMRGESVARDEPHTIVSAPHSQPIGAAKPRRTRAAHTPQAETTAPASGTKQIDAGEPSGTKVIAHRSARTRARNGTNPRVRSPVSNPIGTGDSSGDVAKASLPTFGDTPVANIGAVATHATLSTIGPPPSPTPNSGQRGRDTQSVAAAEDEGAVIPLDAEFRAPPHPAIPALIQMQRRRVFAIRTTGILDRKAGSFVASYIHAGEGPPDKATFARVAKIVRAVETGARVVTTPENASPPRKTSAKANDQSDAIATDDSALAEACAPVILGAAAARRPFSAIREDAEKEMVRLAKQLPVWEWAEGVRGLGALGVAIIAACASGPRGDVGSYATKERLWKRLGLAVMPDGRQRMVAGDAAIEHGYNPQRRAEIWTIADSMFRHQWAGAKEDTAAHPTGPYGEVYMRRKAATEGREWSLARREADARRVMSKALIEDYWRVWRGLAPLYGVHSGE